MYSYINPNQGYRFLLHILLLMGRSETEINLCLHPTICNCFRYAKVVGNSDDFNDLQCDCNRNLRKFKVDQMMCFSNSRRVIAHWTVLAGQVVESAILHNKMFVTKMPSVQFTSLLASTKHDVKQSIITQKQTIVDVIFQEL